MNFTKHYNLEGKHALLGASNYHWLNYNDEKLIDYYEKINAKHQGTLLHAFAAQCISLGQKLPRSQKTLNMYVNDAIGFGLVPEQILYYSENCFGTADSIGFRKNFLRVHDYKSGEIPASMKQLYIYVALFCLEYDVNPADINIETRIYQMDNIIIDNPKVDTILPIMDKIVSFDKLIKKIKMSEAGYEFYGIE
jgi:hypothetical protein